MRTFADDHDPHSPELELAPSEDGMVTWFDPDDLRGEKWLQIDADALVEARQP